MVTEEDYTRNGRMIISGGLLTELRTRLGLTRNAMSELLHTSPITYATWEDRPDVRIWASTAARVGRFYERAIKELNLLTEQGYELEDLVPFHLAATMLGVPQELLLRRYRDGEVDAVDAGILGLWVAPAVVEALK
jgi:transcriptional regulator with XRE-family HTH domain